MRSSLSKLLRAYTAGNASCSSNNLLQIGNRLVELRSALCNIGNPRAHLLHLLGRGAFRELRIGKLCFQLHRFSRKFFFFFAQALSLLLKINQARQRNSYFRAAR